MSIDDEDEDSPDELWDDDGDRGDDGEWAGGKAFRSPSPGQLGANGPVNRMGSKSVKTGEKDLRSEFRWLSLNGDAQTLTL